MGVMLVLRCAALGFAIAVAATVGVLAGPVPAGLALVTFLLGAVTNEMFQMRFSSVEGAAAPASEPGGSDSAFLALLQAGTSGETAAPGASPLALPAQPPPPPKRNFRATCEGLAIGSGQIRLELVKRRRLHATAAAWRADAEQAPKPQVAPPTSPLATKPEPAAREETLLAERAPEPKPEPRPEPVPQPEPAPVASDPRPAPAASRHDGPPPPRVTVLAGPGVERKRAATDAFRSSYAARPPR